MDFGLWFLTVCCVSIVAATFLLFCLRIKSTKRTPELLGTAGTVKVIGVEAGAGADQDAAAVIPSAAESAAEQGQSRVVPQRPSPPSAAAGALVGGGGHSPLGRPPPMPPLTIAGSERKLPDLPAAINNNIYENGSVTSELYDTVGYSTVGGPVGGATSNAV